jgi:flagellar biosynthesis/type III secretory pathway protein FliH
MIKNELLYELFRLLGLKEENFSIYDIQQAEILITEALEEEGAKEYQYGYDEGYKYGYDEGYREAQEEN